jgi:DNA polymerase-3 subunit delta
MRLHLVRGLVDNHNQSLDEAMKMLQPPVFFKAADQFKAQVNRWSQKKCRAWIARLNDAENRTKQTGAPVETLLSQLLLGATG